MEKRRTHLTALLIVAAVLFSFVASQPNVRKELTRLSDDELLELRRAFEKMQADEGDCGYQSISAIHGLPEPVYCPHGVEIFLWWHRAYLLRVEECLQRFAPNIGIPFWDWTSNDAIVQGIPPALADLTYYDPVDRREKPNPLYSALIGFNNTQTTRNPRDSTDLLYLRRIINRSLTYANFTLFTDRYELAHDLLHVWVGGTMQQVVISSYDPLFYFHHTNVDRLLSTWQEIYPESPLSDEIKSVELPPFSSTPEQLILVDYKYQYLYEPPTDVSYLVCESNTIRPTEFDMTLDLSRSMMTVHSYLIDVDLISLDNESIKGKSVVTNVGRFGVFGEGLVLGHLHSRALERSLSITEAVLDHGMRLCPSPSKGIWQMSRILREGGEDVVCPLVSVSPDRPHLLKIDSNADARCPSVFPIIQLTVMQTTDGSPIREEESRFYDGARITWTKRP